MVVLGGGAVSYERGTPVAPECTTLVEQFASSVSFLPKVAASFDRSTGQAHAVDRKSSQP